MKLIENDLSDEELMEQIKSSDQDAFKELYQRYSHKIFNYIQKKSNKETAEDLAQATFVKVFERAHTYKNEYPVSAWIYTIAKNLLMDLYRQRERKGNYLEKLKSIFRDQQTKEVGQLWKELLLDMDQLEKKNQEVILMRFQEGLDFEEIAKRLDTTPVNARKILSRANKALRELMESED